MKDIKDFITERSTGVATDLYSWFLSNKKVKEIVAKSSNTLNEDIDAIEMSVAWICGHIKSFTTDTPSKDTIRINGFHFLEHDMLEYLKEII